MVNNNTPVLPPNFRYRHVLEKGKPVHDRSDRFFAKHPPMELAKRAKIFSPFDALKGFGDELSRTQEEVAGSFTDDNFVGDSFDGISFADDGFLGDTFAAEAAEEV